VAAAGRPLLTGVRRARPGRVALEVDGRPWRTVPDEVAVGCGLAPGTELDRPLLRRLRRELRRAEALDAAAKALARRDHSARRLRERLERRGIRMPAAEGAVAALAGVGIVDDARLARARARSLAARGWGDAAVADRLEREGLPADLVREALAELEPEAVRAAAVAAGASDRRAAWRLLARRGFATESAEDALGPLDEGA
jgi:regulatory protein